MMRLTKLAAVWLLGVGVLLLGAGIILLLTTIASCSEPGSGFACDVGWYLGAAGSVLGALHVLSALGVWQDWLWACLVGAVVAAVGLIIGLGVMVSQLWWVGSDVWIGLWFVPPLLVAGYAVSLVSIGRSLLTSD
jgi:hypothetical protein